MNYPLFVFLFLSISISNAQEKVYSLREIDSAPVINQCDESLDQKECFLKELNTHVAQTIDITKLNMKKNGRAYVQFEITSEGNIRNVRARSNDKKLEKESERIMSKLVILEPAKINGEEVTVSVTIPVNFKVKLFSSYSDFAENGNPIVSIQEVAEVPLYRECSLPGDKKECFTQLTKKKIRAFILNRNDLKNAVSTGDEIKFYFEINSKADIRNAIVATGGKKLIKELSEFLKTLDIEKPAMDENNNAIASYYQDSLVF